MSLHYKPWICYQLPYAAAEETEGIVVYFPDAQTDSESQSLRQSCAAVNGRPGIQVSQQLPVSMFQPSIVHHRQQTLLHLSWHL